MDKIYIWKDNTWERENNIDDIDFYVDSQKDGNSDYYTTEVDPLLDDQDIKDIIEIDGFTEKLWNQDQGSGISVTEITKIDLKEDEVLMVGTNLESTDEKHKLMLSLTDVFPDNKVIIVPEGTTFTSIQPETVSR